MADLTDAEIDIMLRRINDSIVKTLSRTVDVEKRLRAIHAAAGRPGKPAHGAG